MTRAISQVMRSAREAVTDRMIADLRQRRALIDHLVNDHGADDGYRFPATDTLRALHTASHGSQPLVGHDKPNHTHDGRAPWTL